jgi:DNA-binding HxlR family transcriptional regulator
MAEYRQYCPVARASEILADRWTPLIIRELLVGSEHFNEIERGLPGISRSLLVSRLRHLEDRGVIQRRRLVRPSRIEYSLTEAGCDLRPVIERLGEWGVRWAFGEPKLEELDPAVLVWKMHQRVDRSRLPPGRTVIEFDFTGKRGRRVWLVLTPREVSVCLNPPGFDSDLTVRADLAFFYRVWVGSIDYAEATRCGAVSVDGPRALVSELPRWFTWSPMAPYVRANRERQGADAMPARRARPGAKRGRRVEAAD